ncbi:MAG TPA: phosphoadenylyl-sulfate reductase [Bacteroidetes bacterium]|nr:phosphoadenylyl-sulfate reductase [Bacteroidota bacterium]
MENKNVQNLIFENMSVEERLLWAYDKFGTKLTMTSSFQTQSVPLLFLVSKVIPKVPIIFLDTGFHFAETLAFRDELIQKLGINVVNIKRDDSLHASGVDFFRMSIENPDRCCHINKTMPLKKELSKYDAWITGVRAEQTTTRKQLGFYNMMNDGKIKFCPVLDWSKKDIWTFISRNKLPIHPLTQKGYLSIGCSPCTEPVTEGDDERAGRWKGNSKTECGLHTDINLKGKKKE